MDCLNTGKNQGEKLKNHKTEKVNGSSMFEGKNIHSSPVDGKLLCSYSEKLCMQRRLNGFAFCIRHILEDKGAPFKQCQFFAKYNKSRCINPVPISEKRNYCNSHMQVLGIIPKKLKKKKDSSDKSQLHSCQNNHGRGEKSAQSINQKHDIDGRLGSNISSHVPKKNYHAVKDNKRKDVSRKEGKHPVDSMMPPLRWNPHKNIWKKFLKRRRAGKRFGNIYNPAVEQFRMMHAKLEAETRDLFNTYMFDKSRDNLFDTEEIPFHSDAAPEFTILLEDHPDQDIHRRLKHQRAQLRQSIKTRLEDRSITFSMLQSLVNAAKSTTIATANVLDADTDHKPLRGRRMAKSEAKCAASLISNVRCSKAVLPYSRYCVKHIANDEDQILFGKCTARFAAGSHCGVPVIDLINERPLCNEHALKKINSANKEASLPAKRVKKPDKVDKNRAKALPPRKNLKAQLQKKFAIPNKPTKKSNSHIGYNVSDDDRPPPIKRDSLKLTLKASSSHEWVLEESKSDTEKSESMVVTPRSFERSADNDSSSDIAFDINADSLSSPSLLSEDEDHYPLMNMGRNHHDSFTFDEDDDLLQSTSFTLTRDSRDIRDITSPTLTQLSTESNVVPIGLGGLCPPTKLAIDKQLLDSTSSLRPGQTTPGFKRTLNQAFDNHATESRHETTSPHGTIRRILPDPLFPGQHPLINVTDPNNVHSTRILESTSNLNSVSYSVPPSTSTWAARFTLPTRSDQLTTSGVGFIRVGPTNHNSIYSPPFTLPSPSPRSKADVFKFENNGKDLESDLVVLPREPPSYSSAVRSLDRKFDVEPPLQKVNPDIFLSTIYTVPESSNS